VRSRADGHTGRAPTQIPNSFKILHYHTIMQHILGQEMMSRYAIPLLVFDPIQEEIVEWIPEL